LFVVVSTINPLQLGHLDTWRP